MSDIAVEIKDAAGKKVGEKSVSTDCLDERVRYRLLKEAGVMYLANKRAGTHKTKTRGEVAGAGKKPWRQKGTGRARSGSRKSPVWRGGGTVFGPRPRDYSYSINRKQRRLALRSAVFGKLQAGEAFVLDGVELTAPKTKTLAAALKACGVERGCLIGTKDYDRNLVLSGRNLPGVQVAPISDWNALDVMNARAIVFLPDAFEAVTDGAFVGGAGGNAES